MILTRLLLPWHLRWRTSAVIDIGNPGLKSLATIGHACLHFLWVRELVQWK